MPPRLLTATNVFAIFHTLCSVVVLSYVATHIAQHATDLEQTHRQILNNKMNTGNDIQPNHDQQTTNDDIFSSSPSSLLTPTFFLSLFLRSRSNLFLLLNFFFSLLFLLTSLIQSLLFG